jgi:flagellar motor switch/type III secretory pathway protein FliN
MATAVQSSPAAAPGKAAEPLAGKGIADSTLEVGGVGEIEEEARWKPVLGLPCEMIVDLPLPGFKIADLLKLRAGSVINAHWPTGHDVPLRLNGTLIGWGEFEVMGNHLAVRLTELA